MVNSTVLQTALSEVLGQLIAYLPRLLTAVVILLVGWLLARALAAVTRRVAARIGLDRLASRSGLAEGLAQAQITRPFSELVGILIFWLVFLSVILVTLEGLGLSIATTPLQGLIAYLPNVLAAILVLIAGATLAQFLERTTRAAAASVGIEFHRLLGQLVRVFLLVATVIIAVDQLGFDVSLFTDTLINLVTIAAAGLALTFALGGRDVARNALAGFYAREIYTMGDRIVIEGQEGTLEAIGPVNSEVSIGDDRLWVPNTVLIDQHIRVVGGTQAD